MEGSSAEHCPIFRDRNEAKLYDAIYVRVLPKNHKFEKKSAEDPTPKVE